MYYLSSHRVATQVQPEQVVLDRVQEAVIKVPESIEGQVQVGNVGLEERVPREVLQVIVSKREASTITTQ
jgi:hypothetical protein